LALPPYGTPVSTAKRTAPEERFERYLAEHAYDFEHEPNLCSTTMPDYLISREGFEAVCEVKEFRTTVIRDRLEVVGRAAALSTKQVFGAVRSQVDAAARQLRPLACGDRPLLIVLANPHEADVDLSPEHVVLALYGNPAIQVSIDPKLGERIGETYFADRDGALTAKHGYVSAVLTVHERSLEQDWADDATKRFPGDASGFLSHAREAKERGEVPQGTRRWVHVFHTAAAAAGHAIPLPDALFNDTSDHAWPALDGAYVQVR
jgi:hypothetical protein